MLSVEWGKWHWSRGRDSHGCIHWVHASRCQLAVQNYYGSAWCCLSQLTQINAAFLMVRWILVLRRQCAKAVQIPAYGCSMMWSADPSERQKEANWEQLNLKDCHDFCLGQNKWNHGSSLFWCMHKYMWTLWNHLGNAMTCSQGGHVVPITMGYLYLYYYYCFLLPQSQFQSIFSPFQVCQKPLGSAYSCGGRMIYFPL